MKKARDALIAEIKRGGFPVAVEYDLGGGCMGGLYAYSEDRVIALGEGETQTISGDWVLECALSDVTLTDLARLAEGGRPGDADWEQIVEDRDFAEEEAKRHGSQ